MTPVTPTRGTIGAGEAVRLGIVGTGSISAIHIDAFKKSQGRARIVAVCDTSPEALEQWAGKLGCAAYADYRELLRDPEVAAVDITLPHNLHYPVAAEALETGHHVLVEKPMAPTSAECSSLVRLSERKGLVFTVAENTRFVPSYIEAHRLIEEGALGTIRLVRTFICGSEVERLSDHSLWKGRRDGTVGGAIMDSGPHSFYLLNWLFGGVQSLRASASKLVAVSEVEDNAFVTGLLRNGSLFSAEVTFTAEIPWNERLEVYASDGSLVIDHLCDPPAVVYRGQFDLGSPLESVAADPFWWKGGSISAGVLDFVDAVSNRRPPTVDPRDGLYAIRIVEAAYASLADGGREIVLDELGGQGAVEEAQDGVVEAQVDVGGQGYVEEKDAYGEVVS